MKQSLFPGILLGLLVVALPASSMDLPFCDDWLVVSSADDVVTAVHMGGEYNCCPDHFDYDVALIDNRIEIVETEVLAEEICLCF